MIRPVKHDIIGKLLTRETVGCDVAEQRISTTGESYVSYAFVGVEPCMIASGIAHKTRHIGTVDIVGPAASTEDIRRKVVDILSSADVKVKTLQDGYEPERREWLLRISFDYITDNLQEAGSHVH